ncbi:GEM-interacting protein [Dirofilaria immitis]
MRRFSQGKSRSRRTISRDKTMSSSSLSSKHDLYYSDNDYDYFLTDALVNDIEQFASHAERLRQSLDPSTNTNDGESICVSVHSALSMVSQAVRDLLVRYPAFKTTHVLLPASQLIHSVKELNFDNSNIDASRTLACLEKLEAAVGNTIKQSLRSRMTSRYTTVTLGHKNKHDDLKNGRILIRRHSAFQPKNHDNCFVNFEEMDRMVADRSDGIDLAFERAKAWTKYCKDLLNHVSRRVQLDLEHTKRIQNLANQSKTAISEHYLPLKDVFENSFENDIAFCEQTQEAVKYIQDRFIKSLELRRDEHERQRRTLKNEWLRVTKQVKDTQQELQRARTLFGSRDDGYRKAQEISIRTESTGPAVGSELFRRRKELEKRRKNEEEALIKRDEAQNQVERLEVELERRQHHMEDTKVRIVGQLRELVYRCDQTTKACSTHYFQALANLWVPQPGKYHEFADATRTYIPGAEYMSFLQNLPRRTVSTGSLFRGDNCDGISSENQTSSSSSVSSQRRNAIDLMDQDVIFEKKQKKNPARLLEHAAVEGSNIEIARSHTLQRTRQPTKCAHCETLSLLSTIQCSKCGMTWHKSCLPRITVSCDQNPKSFSDSSRRTSVFGVPLSNQLNGHSRLVPFVLERCVDELQKRGLKVKGIYRTCGVKSKIEQICEDFERTKSGSEVDLSSYHPMNIASVVKLYLRKLPEPLLTHELYDEWISLAEKNLIEEDLEIVVHIRSLIKKLPAKNMDVLQFLLLHLKRVTWFEMDNLMTASNLGAVITPSMIWKHPSPSSTYNNNSFLSNAHLMSKAVELIIKHAFEVFNVDIAEDRRIFFQQYPDAVDSLSVDPELDDRLCEGEGIVDEDLLDDETDAICSSFIPQPPTPDLLKNTSRSARARRSSQSGGLSARAYSLTDRLRGTIEKGDVNAGGNAIRLRSRIDKKRSYTTSILVSPHPDRKLLLPQRQHSAEDSNPFVISSGDVTVDIGKDQFYLPSVTDHCERKSSEREQLLLMELCSQLNSVGKDPENSCTMLDSKSNAGNSNPCIHSTGSTLLQSGDASYI